MPTSAPLASCSTSRFGSSPNCSIPCTHHGTMRACPPLIVLAVLNAEQQAEARGGRR